MKVKSFLKLLVVQVSPPLILFAMTNYFISAVEAAIFILSVVENVVSLFQTKPANPSDRVIRLSFVNNFPLYIVVYWWS